MELLSDGEKLSPFSPSVYRFNPKQTRKFKKIYQETHKTDLIDAFFIADRLRFSPPEQKFNSNMDYLPLQRLTRFRAHIAKQITVEKNYFISHLFLKFSAYSQVKPFSDNFGATSQAVIEEFFSIDELAKISIEKEFSVRNITLSTIPGIGLIYSAGIFAEIGDILRFSNQAQLARYAGLAWKISQSGDFSADETPMMKSAKKESKNVLNTTVPLLLFK